MTEGKNYSGQLVFGLDIGTRSIVGTVGYRNNNRFYAVAQRVKEHETRAMLDGQIHDIYKVGGTIKEVKAELEARGVEQVETAHYKVSWKSVSSTRLDAKALKAERPEIYERYAVSSTATPRLEDLYLWMFPESSGESDRRYQ